MTPDDEDRGRLESMVGSTGYHNGEVQSAGNGGTASVRSPSSPKKCCGARSSTAQSRCVSSSSSSKKWGSWHPTKD